MAVISCNEIYDGRGARFEVQFDSNGRGKWIRSAQKTYQVITDSAFTDEFTVLSATGLPLAGSRHPSQLGVYAMGFEAQPDGSEDGMGWVITVSYGIFDPDKTQENPLDERPRLSWDRAQFERVVEKDTGGNAILNSAGDPFDPPVTLDDSRPVLTITRNEASFDTTLAESYKDCVNTDVFFGWPAGQVKVGAITAEEQWSDYLNDTYVVVKYEFHFNPNGWQKSILDQGYRAKSGATRKLILIDGQPATSPVPLDGSGAQLSATGTPVFLAFTVYPTAAFADFAFNV